MKEFIKFYSAVIVVFFTLIVVNTAFNKIPVVGDYFTDIPILLVSYLYIIKILK
jgi:hypothetical protein